MVVRVRTMEFVRDEVDDTDMTAADLRAAMAWRTRGGRHFTGGIEARSRQVTDPRLRP